MNICPDYNSAYYKELIKIHGAEKASMVWFNEEIMKLSGEKSDNIIKAENVVYSAVFFNTDEVIEKYPQVHPNLYSHHSTIEFKPSNIDNLPIGENKGIKITGRLTTDKVDVLIVDNPLSKNKYAHITLSTAEGVKPFESNKEIENNKDKIQVIDDNLNGTIGVFDGKNEITTSNNKKLFSLITVNLKAVKKAVKKKKNQLTKTRLKVKEQIANKPVSVTINDEQQRLYRVQRVDSNGKFIPNEFLDIKTQNDAIDSIFSSSYLAVMQTPLNQREKLTEGKLIDTVLDNIVFRYNELIEIEDLPLEEQQESPYYQYLPYIDFYEEIAMARVQIKKFALDKFNKVNLDIKRLAEEISETMEEQNDRTTYKTSEERNPKETMSDRVKLFISTSIEYMFNGETSVPIKNSIGFDKIVSESIYEKLLQIFANKPNLTLEEVVETLKKDESKQPTLHQLGLKLESDTIEDRVKSEVVSAFKKVNLKAYVTQYTKDGDSFTFMTFEGNRNSYLQKIIEIWKQEQKLNGTLLSYDKNNNIVINEQKVAELVNKVNEINNNDDSTNEDYDEVFNELLDGLGITLSDLAKEDIRNSAVLEKSVFYRYNNKTLKEQFSFTEKGDPIGLFSDILYTLSGKSKYNVSDDANADAKLIVRNPLYVDDKAVRFLGEIQGRYSDIVTSTHTTVEGKKTYDYLLPAFQYTEFLKAKFSEEYRDELSKDIFAQNSFIFRRILLNDKVRNDYEVGLFEAIKNERSRKGVTRSNMSERENIMVDFNNFLNNSDDYANYFDLTKSDKSTSPFHYKVPKLKEKADIMIEYFHIFNAEYLRIKNQDKIKTLSGQLKKGAGIFFLLPMFNYEMMLDLKEKNILSDDDIKVVWEDSEKINPDIDLNNEKFMAILGTVVDNMLTKKIDTFKDIIENESIPITTGNDMADTDIYLYMANKHIFNISLAMFYSGDPASFYKGNSNSLIDNINTTYDQYTKRLAKDIAPGIAGDYKKESYTAITIEVPKMISDSFLDLDLNNYYGFKNLKGQIDSSDASQFSSVKRYFQILYDYGRVTEKVYNEIQNRKDPNELLTEEQMSYIAPMKPVEVNRNTVNISKELTYSHINYIKSFLFPLVPNIVNGTHMEQLMLLMDKHNIDQTSLDSAGKSGNPVETLKPFDIDNNWVFDEENIVQLTNATRTMRSDAFLIQQELPYDETKEKITFITQLNKLVIDTVSFIPQAVFNFQGNMLTGEQIASKKEEIRIKMLDLSFEELKEEFGIKEDGTIDKQKIVDYIIRTSDDLTTNQVEELKLDAENNFVIPLMFNRSSNQIQSKLGAAVRKAIQVKINGKSFVQASSLGIGSIDKSGNLPNQVIRVKGWKGDKLRPLRAVIDEFHNLGLEIYLTQEQLNKAKNLKPFKLTTKQKEIVKANADLIEGNPNITLTGEYSIKMLPAEVLVPFNFFDNNENRIKIDNFLDADGNVDIDKDLLKLIGARIPNQSHSSQLPITIVGFLPAIGGDVMFVPAEITKQMGSDFDVDKLYIYKKKYSYFKKSKEIDRLKKLDVEIEKLSTSLSEFKLSDEEIANVKKAEEEYFNNVNSEMFLSELKDRVLQDESVNDKNPDILKFVNELTLKDVDDFKYLTFTKNKDLIAISDLYKDKKIAKLVAVIKRSSFSLKQLLYNDNTVEVLENIEIKNKFKKTLTVLKQAQQERKELGSIVKKQEINSLSTDITLDKLGNSKPEDVDQIEHYKNDYFDVLFSILISPNVFEKVMQPLDMNDLKEVVNMRNDSNKNTEINDLFDPIKQLKSYTSNVGVKALVGTFSLHLTFNALLQRTSNIDLKLHKINIGGIKLNTFSGLGRSNFKAIIEGEKVNDKRTTSDNIIIPQTEAVDHANNQIADKVNLSSNTVNAYAVVLQLKNSKGQSVGNEYASQLINNAVIKAYINNLRTFQDGFNDARGSNGEREAYFKTLIDLDFSPEQIALQFKNLITDKYTNINLTDSVLGIVRDNEGFVTSMNEPNPIDYITILNSFIELSKIGDEFFQFLIATNFDTKGFGTNLLEGLHKEKLVAKLKVDTKYISNFQGLLTEPNNTGEKSELGHTVDLSVDILNSLSTLFDYNILDDAIEKIRIAKNKKELRPIELRTIINNFQSYVYSFPVMWNNIQQERYRLLYSENNLTSRLVLMKQKHSDYLLFKKLELRIADNTNEPNYIAYRTLDIEQDAQYIYNEFFALLNSSDVEISNFMVDLVKYAYITGGISNFNSFVNLIPPSVVEQLLANNLKEVLISSNFNEEGFVRQYFQHNPEEATPHPISFKGVNMYKKRFNDLNNVTILNLEFADIKEGEEFPRFVYMKGGTYEGKKKTFLYEKVKGTVNKYIQLDILGDYNSNEYDYMVEYAESTIPLNRSIVNTKEMIEVLNSFAPPLIVNDKRITDIVKNVNGNLVSTLFMVAKQESEFKELTNILFLYHKVGKGVDINIEISDDYSNYDGNRINLYSKSGSMLKDLMHEVLHHETYNYLKDNNNIITYKLNMIRQEAMTQLSSDDLRIISALSELNGKAKIDLLEEIRIGNNLTYEHLSKLYYLSDVNEFVTGAFTDKDFQLFLNNIRFDGENESLFTKFKLWLDRLITEISRNIGIEVNNDSLLYATIEQVFLGFDSDIATTSNADTLFSQADMEEAKEYVKQCKL